MPVLVSDDSSHLSLTYFLSFNALMVLFLYVFDLLLCSLLYHCVCVFSFSFAYMIILCCVYSASFCVCSPCLYMSSLHMCVSLCFDSWSLRYCSANISVVLMCLAVLVTFMLVIIIYILYDLLLWLVTVLWIRRPTTFSPGSCCRPHRHALDSIIPLNYLSCPVLVF